MYFYISNNAHTKTKKMTLINNLTEKTQDLRNEFIAKTSIYAVESYAAAFELISMNHDQLMQRYGVTITRSIAGKDASYLTLSKAGGRAYDAARLILSKGFEAYKAKQIKMAEAHYTQSVAKLAARLISKGLNENEPFTIESGRVAQNIEIKISHAGKTTKAWTIIAEGPCVRPHYRYLVK